MRFSTFMFPTNARESAVCIIVKSETIKAGGKFPLCQIRRFIIFITLVVKHGLNLKIRLFASLRL